MTIVRAYNKQQEITNLDFTVKQAFLFYFTSLQSKRLQKYKRKLQQNDIIQKCNFMIIKYQRAPYYNHKF